LGKRHEQDHFPVGQMKHTAQQQNLEKKSRTLIY